MLECRLEVGSSWVSPASFLRVEAPARECLRVKEDGTWLVSAERAEKVGKGRDSLNPSRIVASLAG